MLWRLAHDRRFFLEASNFAPLEVSPNEPLVGSSRDCTMPVVTSRCNRERIHPMVVKSLETDQVFSIIARYGVEAALPEIQNRPDLIEDLAETCYAAGLI